MLQCLQFGGDHAAAINLRICRRSRTLVRLRIVISIVGSILLHTALADVVTTVASADDEGSRPALGSITQPSSYNEVGNKRTPLHANWTTSRIHGTPEPAAPFTTELAFPSLHFVEPVSLVAIPDSDRLCVVERSGKIYTFPDDRHVTKADLLIDLGRTVYGIAFHPDCRNNGLLYVTSYDNPSEFDDDGGKLSCIHFQSNPIPKANASAEEVLLTFPSGGHNGGCVRFGPDGMLYFSAGDGSGIADSKVTGQDISDLSASILRIDVNHRDPGKRYAIPLDNPFVDRVGARGEVYAFGLRNVWKFSFDSAGRLWAGDVGQDLWEAVYLIESGGNYGWSVSEAGMPFRPDRPLGPKPVSSPIVRHDHSHFRSVTGGYVFESDRIGELKGAYIYGDYDTGQIWSLRYENGRVTEHRSLADTRLRPVDFGQLKDGEVFIVDFVGGGIHRLVPAPPENNTTALFPHKLSETGLFASVQAHEPAPGVIPYDVNAPLWSDGAEKERFLALPDGAQIKLDAAYYPHVDVYADIGWLFPNDTVLVKTFTLALDESQPEKRRRLETRILHHRRMPGHDDEYGAQVWNGYTYVWNDEQTDAELLDENSLDREFTILDPAAPDGVRTQTWHFPSRSECAGCHSMGAKYVLGVNTMQLNRIHDYGTDQAQQLDVLDHLGVFAGGLPISADKLPQLVDYRDQTQPLDMRARAYLHANCAHCHRKFGGGNAEFVLKATLPLSDLKVIDTPPAHGSFELESPRILKPGDSKNSLISVRMQRLGLGRMPHIGSKRIDAEGVKLIEAWIDGLDVSSSGHQAGVLRPGIPGRDENGWAFSIPMTAVITVLAFMLIKMRSHSHSKRVL